MRGLLSAAAILAMTTGAVAADEPSFVTDFPDTASHRHVYLFNLGKLDNAPPLSPSKFCEQMDYGEAVLSDPPDKDKTGKLKWVICRFRRK
jgi:hypothetical protein